MEHKKLKKSETCFRSVVDAAPVMLWMSGADARCTFFNKAWLSFTGLSLEEQTEHDWVVRVHPEDRERCVNQYLSAFKSRETFAFEYRVMRNDGVYRWVLHEGVPRYAEDHTFEGYVGSRVDVTDRRQVEEHLREVTNKLLNAQEIERTRIGHELGENVAQKLCALQMTLSRFSCDSDGSDKLPAQLEQLQERLKDVSNDVVRLSRQLRPAPVQALALSAALRDLCQQASDDKRVVLFVQKEDIPPLAEHASVTLYRVAQESLRNALNHSGASHINVELGVSPKTVRLLVKDDGHGFVVGLPTTSGLGLSAMSERMRNSGGNLTIISNPGEGTTVIATMPLTHLMTIGSTA